MFNFVQVQASGPWGLRPGGEDEGFNRRHTLSISRIYPPPNFGGLKSESDAEIGQKGTFCKGLNGIASGTTALFNEEDTYTG